MSPLTALLELRASLRLKPFDTSSEEGRSKERQRRALLTMIADVFARGCGLIVLILTLRIALPYLGQERYGILATVISFASILIALDLGIGIETGSLLIGSFGPAARRVHAVLGEGVTVERAPRQVRVDAIDLLEFSPPFVKFHLACSKGTYVRQVAEDVGEALGCGACITEIRRTKVGPFTINEAVKLDDVHENHLRQWHPPA